MLMGLLPGAGNMECSEARKLILLDAGGDLYSDERTSLQRHLQDCDGCSQYDAGMQPVMSVLSHFRDTPGISSPVSVWPSVRSAIRLRSAASAAVPSRRFNLQVAALAVCSLSLAAAVIVQTLSTMRSAEERPQVLVMPQFQAAPADLRDGRAVPVMMGQSGFSLPQPQSADPAVF
jgi:hypothetical protein